MQLLAKLLRMNDEGMMVVVLWRPYQLNGGPVELRKVSFMDNKKDWRCGSFLLGW